MLGQHLAKKHVLAAIYALRSLVIVVFLASPLTPLSVYVFSAVMGLLWLSTVPPTNAVVAQIFGVAHLSMLGGFVFFSHQIGSFLGVWLGGFLYDRTGSYDVVWWIAVALGVFAGLAGSPVRLTDGVDHILEAAERLFELLLNLAPAKLLLRWSEESLNLVGHRAEQWPHEHAQPRHKRVQRPTE